MKLEAINLKKHPTLNEKWVQEQIADDPTILGLGELILRDKERIQNGGGRLDLLLQDPDTLKRYEVEIQLGSVDESHIIRTVEYWDIERKRYPQYEHAAVIIAEEITARFLNVISLFNGAIPLIALKMTAYKVGNEVALTFVKVLDEVVYGPIDEDEPIAEPTDRDFWKKRSSEKSLKIVDELLQLVNEVDPKAVLKYNRQYIGLSVNESANNFVSFRPLKTSVTMKIKLSKSEEFDKLIEATDLETLSYETVWRQYRVRIDSALTVQQRGIVLELIQQAKDQFGLPK
jgi:hypothetical protein